jgi:hypothetical protein
VASILVFILVPASDIIRWGGMIFFPLFFLCRQLLVGGLVTTGSICGLVGVTYLLIYYYW